MAHTARVWQWGVVAVVLAVYAATMAWMPAGGFWGNDSENKFIVLQSIARRGKVVSVNVVGGGPVLDDNRLFVDASLERQA